MGLLEFSKLPVNTLVGADWKTFKEMTRGQEIAPDKRTKYYLTKSVCRLLSLLAPIAGLRRSWGRTNSTTILFSFSDIGEAGRPLCTTSLRRMTISVIRPRTRPYSPI